MSEKKISESQSVENNTNSKLFAAVNIALIVFILDQISKLLALKFIRTEIHVIPGFFNLVLVKNKGAAWGKFKDYPVLLACLALVAIIFLVWKFREISEGCRIKEFALSMLIGGIAGNLFDRIIRGAVVDFLDFYVGKFHWPAFNVADSAITLGVISFIISTFITHKKQDNLQI